MRRPTDEGRITVVYHGLARAQQPRARPLTSPGQARKRRAVFGFWLSVSPSGENRGGGVVEFQAWLGSNAR
jgi:hypothetical protein